MKAAVNAFKFLNEALCDYMYHISEFAMKENISHNDTVTYQCYLLKCCQIEH